MVTRIVDEQGRIALPSRIYSDFSDGFAYFCYSSQKQEVYVASLPRICEFLNQLDKQYGFTSQVNYKRRDKERRIGSNLFCSSINTNKRVVIPEAIRHAARIGAGDLLEARILQRKGVALIKVN